MTFNVLTNVLNYIVCTYLQDIRRIRRKKKIWLMWGFGPPLSCSQKATGQTYLPSLVLCILCILFPESYWACSSFWLVGCNIGQEIEWLKKKIFLISRDLPGLDRLTLNFTTLQNIKHTIFNSVAVMHWNSLRANTKNMIFIFKTHYFAVSLVKKKNKKRKRDVGHF